MTNHRGEENDSQDQEGANAVPSADDEGCQYVHEHCDRKGQKCGRPRHTGADGTEAEFCFWHHGRADKRGDLRQILEDLAARGTCLEGFVLAGADLRGARLLGARLDAARLRGTQLQHADLYGAHLHAAYLEGAQLQGARLIFADLEEAILWGAVFDGASLYGARLARAKLHQCRLRAVDLILANLQGAELAGVALHEANLGAAQLQGARFLNTDLRGAELRNAELDETTALSDILLDERTDLTGVHWPPGLILRNERDARVPLDLRMAATLYRDIRRSYEAHAEYSLADAFHFREMECLRRTQPRWANYLVWTPFYKFLCGYGTKPLWTFWWLFGVWAIAALLLPLLGIEVAGQTERLTLAWHLPGIGEWAVLGHGVILSLASLATLTFSNLAPATKAGEFLASAEALAGVLLAAVFIVSFARKMIR